MEFCKFKSEFIATTIIDRALLPNQFEVAVTFSVNVVDPMQQNVAFQRMKHLIEGELNLAVILCRTNPMYKTLGKLQNKLVVLPDDGPDWALACALLLKLNAVCEDRFIVNLVELSSTLGDRVTYYADFERKEMLEEVLADLPKADHWWKTPYLQFNGFQKCASWADLDLDWKLTKDKKDATIGQIVKFNPKVVPGGLN